MDCYGDSRRRWAGRVGHDTVAPMTGSGPLASRFRGPGPPLRVRYRSDTLSSRERKGGAREPRQRLNADRGSAPATESNSNLAAPAPLAICSRQPSRLGWEDLLIAQHPQTSSRKQHRLPARSISMMRCGPADADGFDAVPLGTSGMPAGGRRTGGLPLGAPAPPLQADSRGVSDAVPAADRPPSACALPDGALPSLGRPALSVHSADRMR